MPKNKKSSKLQKFTSWLRPTSPLKGMLLFAIVFAVIGGSYLAFKSFAVTYPPSGTSNTDQVSVVFTTTDGVKNQNGVMDKVGAVSGWCMAYQAQSTYGLITRCVQERTKAVTSTNITYQFRTVIGNLTAKVYQPDMDWLTFTLPRSGAGGGVLPYDTCKNTGNIFSAAHTVPTTYGLVGYGQRFRLTIYGVWQVSFATRSVITGNCGGLSDVWYTLKGTW